MVDTQEKFKSYICDGNIEAVENMLDNNPYGIGGTFRAFNREHSWIMFAIRIGEFSIAELIIEEYDGKILDYEKDEIKPFVNEKRVDIMAEIINTMFTSDKDNGKITELMEKLNKYSALIN